MTTSHTLLSLPAELRQQIWSLIIANRDIYPFHSALDIVSSDCAACQRLIPQSTSISSFTSVFSLLLVNKQIYTEAAPIFYDTFRLHISSHHALHGISTSARDVARRKTRHLTLYTHLNGETRYHWLPELGSLAVTFPSLQTLKIHNHMRAPTSYDRLIDGVYLLGPLIALPSYLRPQAPPEQTAATEHTSGLEDDNNNKAKSHSQTPHAKAAGEGANFSISFAYTRDDVLFESPFIGSVTTADAIDAHEAVLRDCIADKEFRAMATAQDLNGMTVVMLGIARSHEQTWLDELHRRRLGESWDQADFADDMDGEEDLSSDYEPGDEPRDSGNNSDGDGAHAALPTAGGWYGAD